MPCDAPTDTQSTITLVDLPSEIVVHVLGFVQRPSHLVAARMASRVFGCVDVVARAGTWALCPEHARAFIVSRAPCDMIARAFPLYVSHAAGQSNPESLLEVAVRGGRVEVLRLVHQYITVRITSLFFVAFFSACTRSFFSPQRIPTDRDLSRTLRRAMSNATTSTAPRVSPLRTGASTPCATSSPVPLAM